MKDLIEKNKGVLGWFARNHVAANLLMLLILAGGVLSLSRITVEIFPETSIDIITVTVPYLGASPAEVEDGICLRVEEAVVGIEGIKRIRSTASEGVGTTILEVEDYEDATEVLDKVKAEVDQIITFPVETEKPIIREITIRQQVLSIAIYGDVSERTLRYLAEHIRDELTAMPNISQVDLSGVRRFEISIEVSEESLRRWGLSFDQIVAAVGSSSLDLPGGSVKTKGGEILIRTKGQMYVGSDFEDIVVLTRSDGTKIYLSDIAEIKDTFEDSDIATRFDGKPAVMLNIFRVGKQGALDVADTVKNYIAEQEGNLPKGVSISTWYDRSSYLKSRLRLLQRNGLIGLTLVFLVLSLFLELRLAFWTTMGIPISFMGAFWLMPVFDVSVNMISLFAFILALGIVVDDAIVVGENIFSYRQQGHNHLEAAILGVKEMCAPVIMAVLTTILAFMPLLMMAGIMGKFIRVLPIIVISVLTFSLIEALCILPAHLSGDGIIKSKEQPGPIGRLQRWVRYTLDGFVYNRFSKFVEKVVAWRYVTIAVAIAVLLSMIGYIGSGRIKFAMLPKMDADNVWATVRMPQGTSVERTKVIVERIERAAYEIQQEIDAENGDGEPSVYRHMSTSIGSQPFAAEAGGVGPGESGSGSHIAEINIELLTSEDGRKIGSGEIARMWRERVGEAAGVSNMTFSSEFFSAGDAVNVELSHYDFDKLLEAVEELKGILNEYEGVTDVDDSFEPGKLELKLSLKEQGRTLGLTLSDLARQARQGFYGQEVQRVQRGRDDIRVMVRYPQEERKSLADIENMRIRLADGTEIPFGIVADVQEGRGYATINRADQRRIVNVTADVVPGVANANEINRNLLKDVLPKLRTDYPGLIFRFEGEQREQKETMESLRSSAIVALLAIFGLLAVQFKSYIQPAIIMSAIPFGLVGAVIGHIVLGFDLSMLSMFGIVALTGVVVNDSLIMIDLINRERRAGIEIHQVIRDSATRRFRPIMLTTLTTFCGLIPMMLEKSLQARFLIPMAVSLAFGVLFATMITLLLVPSLYMILEDIKMLPSMIRRKGAAEKAQNKSV